MSNKITSISSSNYNKLPLDDSDKTGSKQNVPKETCKNDGSKEKCDIHKFLNLFKENKGKTLNFKDATSTYSISCDGYMLTRYGKEPYSTLTINSYFVGWYQDHVEYGMENGHIFYLYELNSKVYITLHNTNIQYCTIPATAWKKIWWE